ncbi:hypothetical protein [Paracoccus sp. (in: a-proteobacteria)]|uniref:hypothetical protein n=1 Tax=Paracoccus sp. TaxID=267 RepID=UPI0028A640C6|nr:hypothetical protein [Paracoccus sp. (in: a-proteobacteria)]
MNGSGSGGCRNNTDSGAGGWLLRPRVPDLAGDGQVVKIEGAGPFNLAVTFGSKSIPHHRAAHWIDGNMELPLVAAQYLWANAGYSWRFQWQHQ